MNRSHFFPPLVALVCSVTTQASAAEPLTDSDRKELSELYGALHADMKIGVQSNYAKYLDPASLDAFMRVHQSFASGMLQYMTEDQLGQMMKFTPDVQAALKEKDPKKFFENIEAAPAMTAMANMANVGNKVVGVTGDSSKAFVVVEGFMGGDLGKTDPFYSVWPAIKTDKGWRLDVTSNLVRELRINVKKLDQELNPRDI
ncbi:MAG: hypothetical protein H7A50_13160 [Akkermansiaceae bacterium]|nr:hypothetical protein [Akkermansiaceae bacterium]